MKKLCHFFSIIAASILSISFASASHIAIEATNVPNDKALGEFSYSLALQAADWGYPIVTMYNLRYNDALKPGAKSKPNQIWRLTDIVTPHLATSAGYVTPNVNVLYGFGFLDLSREPIILNAPDSHGLYYMIQMVDMYTNSFAYIGGVATGYKGGKFALVGPNWRGRLPIHVKKIVAPTPWILIQPRVHVINEADLENAKKVLNQITIQSLSQYLKRPEEAKREYHFLNPQLTNPNLPVSALNFKDPLQFWEILAEVINENPPPQDQIQALLPMFKLLGIELGKPWNANNVLPQVLASMKRAAQRIALINAQLPIGRKVNGWFVSPVEIGNFGSDYFLRAIVARVGLTANIPREAIYFMAKEDNDHKLLMGSQSYTLTFVQQPPFKKPGFWSITIYDLKNNYTIPNPINRYSLGSDNELKLNHDGSLTIYIQKTNPGKDKESNWLPAGDGPFYLILRSYAPGEAMIESLSDPKSYAPPAIMK